MIISRDSQHAAMGRGAFGVGMFEYVAAPVYTGSFAVPHAEYAIVARPRKQGGLLASPHRGGGQVFVDAGLEVDVILFKKALGAPKLLIDTAQRGTAIP